MKFVLQLGPREIELPLGRFIVGRAENAGLSLDDPLVSRHHAAIDVTDAGATLVDLDSRNGVRVNGKKLKGSRQLSLGDRVAIGSTDFVFAVWRPDPAVQTLTQVPTLRMTAFGLFGMLADKAIALGRWDEAERLLGPQIEHLLSDVERGKKYDPANVERAAGYALRLAQATSNPAWMSAVLRFYSAMKQLCPSAMVDELYVAAHKVKQPNVAELRSYIAVVRDTAAELSPADRFLVNRLEGLERSLG
ncbi:MAG TPA: FHA domain-containing protein [Polyangiaceae bacterium]|nr:FHA domain-containing protein [Polyangiaceae bacterium]